EATPALMMGRPIPGHIIHIIDQDGHPLPAGTVGEIGVKSPHPVMFLHYWGRAEQTAAKFINGYLKTGDLGICDTKGYFRFVARDDDIITSSGYRIGPTEIENCLMSHPQILMAAIIGVPCPERTEAIKAILVLQDKTLCYAERQTLGEALILQVKERLSPHLAPRIIEWRDSLPLTATGKIMRRTLRDEH
ncbi:MAG: AMP-binding protein, partial [Alphaproteobacteria bacterium]|nr:AMP-binding protein [Alphaproteobacteria bacterium]